MSATIYSAPKEIKTPKFSPKTWMEDEMNYKAEVAEWLKTKLKAKKNVGEVIRFQVADGYAEYMVVSMRPLKLIHLEIGDGYQFAQAHLLDAKEVQKMIDREKALSKLFPR